MTNAARPEGKPGAGKPGVCNREDCAYSPRIGCMCGLFGEFLQVEKEWHSGALTVLLTQYEHGGIWTLTYGYAAMDANDSRELDSLEAVLAEAETAWTAAAPADGPGARMHCYAVLA